MHLRIQNIFRTLMGMCRILDNEKKMALTQITPGIPIKSVPKSATEAEASKMTRSSMNNMASEATKFKATKIAINPAHYKPADDDKAQPQTRNAAQILLKCCPKQQPFRIAPWEKSRKPSIE